MLLGVSAGAAATVAPATTATVAEAPSALLERADTGIKLADHAQFSRLLDQLDARRDELSAAQLWQLRYLRGWQAAYAGDYDRSRAILDEVLDKATDDVIRFRAAATLINILGDGHRYQEAFVRLSQMQDQLPGIKDDTVRYQGLGEAAQLLISAGQYDLAAAYADQMLAHIPPGESTCKAMYFKIHARFRAGDIADTSDTMLNDGISACARAGQSVFANALRADAAGVLLHNGRHTEAITLLQRTYADTLRDGYIPVSAQFEALLARAYFHQADIPSAEKYAQLAVASNIKSGITEPLSIAYEVLYRIAEGRGDFRAALDYHEKYMAADKGYLDDVSATALAYQIVSQQVQAKKQQVDTLNKQNVILKLQQALDRKAVENGRLYIALLLTVIAFIVFWVYRLKRSQLRFMWLSRQDSLTGICNRKHFIEAAELELRHADKAGRTSGLLLIDLDHFKLVNDTHGHAMGDQVLRRAVDACRPLLGPRDLFGRLGGEEFAILLAESDPDRAVARAEEVRLAIAAPVSDTADGIVISASLGVVTTLHSGYQFRQLLIDADHALYKAKRDGRNRVVVGRGDEVIIVPFQAPESKMTAG